MSFKAILQREFSLSGRERVILRVAQPEPDGADWRCDYEITWPGREIEEAWAYGVDGMQALLLALQKAHVSLLTAPEREDGLRWLDNDDFGLPLSDGLKYLA